jgi:tetratricopeptide (TPR) repeat protein
MEQIGEGGMGLVFVAEQQQPVRRKVALKVIKPGMDTRQVIARFEAERQALALMDHPNIAKVLDGGETDSGRPYFVMELVKGVPITEYCDQNQVTVRDRLELFLHVCRAVQHAHQKGIIHRDIKPSNVLIMSQDGTPLVKVIDFGVARQQLTEKTIYTQFTQLVGTPLYMSPEQAGQSGMDVDTRTDIYSLGVLLYELLTGSTPFDKDRLKEADYDEIRRIIREEEPPKPSTRVSTLGQAASTVATQRQSDPNQLGRMIRGELDWIVMKCLEKDRNRRYDTASALAADLQRYLHDEPVLACPPSAWYRLRKFARRKKGPVLAAALVLLALVGGIAGTSWQAVQAMLAERQAKDSQVAAEKQQRLAEKNAAEAAAQRRQAEAHLERAREITGAYSALAQVLQNSGQAREAAKAYGQILAFWEKLAADFPDKGDYQDQLAKHYWRFANLLRDSGQLPQAAKTYLRSAAAYEKVVASRPLGFGPSFGDVICFGSVCIELGDVLRTIGRSQEADEAYRRPLAIWQANPRGPWRYYMAQLHTSLGMLRADSGRAKEAEKEYRYALSLLAEQDRQFIGRTLYLEEWARSNYALGNLLWGTCRFPQARQSYRLALACGECALSAPSGDWDKQADAAGAKGTGRFLTIGGLGDWNHQAWRLATCPDPQLRNPGRAVELAQKSVARWPQRRGCWDTLGTAHYGTRDWKAAISALEKGNQLRAGGDSFSWFFLAMAHAQSGKKEKARKWYDQAVGWMDRNQPKSDELRRFRAEAATLLGIPDPPPKEDAVEPEEKRPQSKK